MADVSETLTNELDRTQDVMTDLTSTSNESRYYRLSNVTLADKGKCFQEKCFHLVSIVSQIVEPVYCNNNPDNIQQRANGGPAPTVIGPPVAHCWILLRTI